ncbi:unnamed protein product [Nesidiocoris tenuis]|uniref:Uncharacterized protein n=1 Tax=Nesidiocoris tenuis TaxID=355587 RepID=A0A6H5HAU9_9HEMI|nr:unnamed protein product [Nesidiocoris tenuis]
MILTPVPAGKYSSRLVNTELETLKIPKMKNSIFFLNTHEMRNKISTSRTNLVEIIAGETAADVNNGKMDTMFGARVVEVPALAAQQKNDLLRYFQSNSRRAKEISCRCCT